MQETPKAAAEYLSSMALELSAMAKRHGYETAAHLFEMAHSELQKIPQPIAANVH